MSVRIQGFRPELAPHFERLNLEWLERYFQVESIDREVLGNPQKSVMAAGGDILFASLDDQIVGCCALKHQGDGVFELTKMAVTGAAQGHGIGRTLIGAVLERYSELGGVQLYLESHDSLVAALKLYESVGFKHQKCDGTSPYARCNVRMEYLPQD
ncbi:MAG: GNAT family N-acetyltransferase [Gammaproteobacteria bacterium]